MLFEERTKLAIEILAKQPPVTIEQAREQALRVMIQSSRFTKDSEPQLRMIISKQHPDWKPEQIETEFERVMTKYKKT